LETAVTHRLLASIPSCADLLSNRFRLLIAKRWHYRALVTSGNGLIGAAAAAAGFRLRLGGGVALRLRSSRLSVCAPLFPLADRRPKPNRKDLTMLLY
jgi:hypothetical protein